MKYCQKCGHEAYCQCEGCEHPDINLNTVEFDVLLDEGYCTENDRPHISISGDKDNRLLTAIMKTQGRVVKAKIVINKAELTHEM